MAALLNGACLNGDSEAAFFWASQDSLGALPQEHVQPGRDSTNEALYRMQLPPKIQNVSVAFHFLSVVIDTRHGHR